MLELLLPLESEVLRDLTSEELWCKVGNINDSTYGVSRQLARTIGED